MYDVERKTTITQQIYEFIKAKGCATIEEIARAVNIPTRQAYLAMRTLFARRLVLPYRPQVGRERIYCIPAVGDKMYGQRARANSSGVICITLSIDMIEMVDEIAMNTGKTRSSLIKQALTQLINEYYTRDNQQKPPEDKQQKSPEDEGLDFIVPDR